MQLTTTISQKGQIVVPKEIRDKLNLKPSDILKVSIKNNVIIAEPVSSTQAVFGMFKTKKVITKSDIKDAYQKNISQKHK